MPEKFEKKKICVQFSSPILKHDVLLHSSFALIHMATVACQCLDGLKGHHPAC